MQNDERHVLNEKALVIDKYYQPVMIISIRKAFCLIFSGKAESIKEDNQSIIRSTKNNYFKPTVIKIFHEVNLQFRVSLNRWTIFARDNFTCTYCNKPYQKKALTLDHINPISKGGKNTWENLITACSSCNQKKSNKTIQEAGLKMHFKPYKPVWSATFLLKISQIYRVNNDWKDFISYEESSLALV